MFDNDESDIDRCRRLLHCCEKHKTLAIEKRILSKQLQEQSIEHEQKAYDLQKEARNTLDKHTINSKRF